ncbi:MAG: hypothetical protein BJ554DRAFT_4662, partial [Olpidium bornovanus]
MLPDQHRRAGGYNAGSFASRTEEWIHCFRSTISTTTKTMTGDSSGEDERARRCEAKVAAGGGSWRAGDVAFSKLQCCICGSDQIFWARGSWRMTWGEVRKRATDPNVLGFKGPRKMTVLLPAVDRETGMPVKCMPTSVKDTVVERGLRGDREILVLHNKYPQWNE